jgi:hypothetical protein
MTKQRAGRNSSMGSNNEDLPVLAKIDFNQK